ncbi:MAG: PaaI family thioesterase [Sphingomonadaceae bacterium]|nr:PaaI family thioesterase [Sphingomonadaceae bacterium]
MTSDQLVERFNAKKPPTALLFGTEVLSVDVETKTVRMSFQPDDRVINPRGTIQGGIVTAMLDDCAAYAGIVAMGEPGFIASLELKTSFFSAAYPGQLFAEGRCIKMGKSSCFLEAELTNADGKLLAKLTSTAAPLRSRQPPKLVSTEDAS